MDKDGLTDGQEQSIGTDPFNPDTDGDLFSDGREYAEFDNPLGPEPFGCSSAAKQRSSTPLVVLFLCGVLLMVRRESSEFSA